METKSRPIPKQNKFLAGLGLLGLAAAAVLLCVLVGRPMLELAAEPERFRAWVESRGVTAQLAYIGMVLFQVVLAVIPGEPLEIAGGYAFGAIEGTMLFFLGATLGSLIVFSLVRRLGVGFARLFFAEEKLEKLHFLKNSPRRTILFLLIFMIPGTPKDLLCYFAGLTDMKLGVWLLICSFGRIPSLITSTLGGNALGERSYLSAVLVFGVAMAISAAGLLIYHYICNQHNK